MVPAAVMDGDKRRAGFDESPRQQCALPKLVPSVALAKLGVFATDVERLASGVAGHKLVGLLLKAVHRIEGARGVDVSLQLIQVRAKFFRDPPASTVVRVVELLPTPDILLEVEAIAHIPERRR